MGGVHTNEQTNSKGGTYIPTNKLSQRGRLTYQLNKNASLPYRRDLLGFLEFIICIDFVSDNGIFGFYHFNSYCV